MAYIPLRKAVEFLGLHPNTLRRYADEGKIKSIKNPAGQRLYDIESYITGDSIRTPTICYCRVSSSKQRDDLDRQIAYMQSLYPDAEIIKDIGSGLNFKRKGLRSLLDRLLQGNKFILVVACRDRLARFGFELVQYMVEQNGGQIVVLDKTVHCPQSELTQDLLSILHVFSCRMQGLRKYSKKIKEDLSEIESCTEKEN
ncbi:IS607 family transposase [Dolichospermum circinale CS-537/03]|uniref:IS607 family transposase n=3 Tax=Dolichospermum circinale TaxID=109265 RepID=UPI00232B0C4C|nr:IS607 family transposase [Dolichospermum circinale]MDB9462144.1 IS607 family transposase [Dolichospermum circinale CS-541/04]MDB9479998.1 IS607 family transposase [Dolichospermum circinale CS-537/03]